MDAWQLINICLQPADWLRLQQYGSVVTQFRPEVRYCANRTPEHARIAEYQVFGDDAGSDFHIRLESKLPEII